MILEIAAGRDGSTQIAEAGDLDFSTYNPGGRLEGDRYIELRASRFMKTIQQ
jgi:hypothetical protein